MSFFALQNAEVSLSLALSRSLALSLSLSLSLSRRCTDSLPTSCTRTPSRTRRFHRFEPLNPEPQTLIPRSRCISLYTFRGPHCISLCTVRGWGSGYGYEARVRAPYGRHCPRVLRTTRIRRTTRRRCTQRPSKGFLEYPASEYSVGPQYRRDIGGFLRIR
jgi:hypothetical protein